MQRLFAVLLLVALTSFSADAEVISAICGKDKVLKLDSNETIIRFSSDGFPNSPYKPENCSATFNLAIPGFFVFEHINLAVEDSVEFSGLGGESKSLSGSDWTLDSSFFYPKKVDNAVGTATFSLTINSEYQTAGFRMWVYPYTDPLPPCTDQVCYESQMLFSPGFPYDHSSAASSNNSMEVRVNGNAYRYAITSERTTRSTTHLNIDESDYSLNISSPRVLSDSNCDSNGFSEHNLTVTYDREAGTTDFFVIAIQSNNDPQPVQTDTETIALKGDLEIAKWQTNDRGSLYHNCMQKEARIVLDPTLNGKDYSIGVWMQYFDSEGLDVVDIGLTSTDMVPQMVQQALHGNKAQGPVKDPNGKRYFEDASIPIQDTRFLSYAGIGWGFSFSSDAMLSGAGGEFKAIAFPKINKPKQFVVTGTTNVVTPGYPHGYATGATANFTFKGAKDEVLEVCLVDYGQTFDGIDTTVAKLDIYEGDKPLNENFLHSYEYESDTKLCAYTHNAGEAMFVQFSVPDTFNISAMINVTLQPFGPMQVPVNMPIPLILGGRIVPSLDNNELPTPGNSLGFWFKVRNVPYEAAHRIVAGNAMTVFLNTFLLCAISVFVWIR